MDLNCKAYMPDPKFVEKTQGKRDAKITEVDSAVLSVVNDGQGGSEEGVDCERAHKALIVDQEEQQRQDKAKISSIRKMLMNSETDQNLIGNEAVSISDPEVVRKYQNRVQNASSEGNSEPVPIESAEGRDMMKLVEECEGLVDCIKNSGLRYSIDGAIGLSLRQLEETKSFLRQHRDIDILVPSEELDMLDGRLRSVDNESKWGLFVWDTDAAKAKGMMSFSRYERSKFTGKEMLVAMPVGDDGSIDLERYDGLTIIDVHYLKERNGTYEYGGLPIDETALFSKDAVRLPNGTMTPVVGLVHMAIAKARADRPQDARDLSYILEHVPDTEKESIRKGLNELLAKTDREEERVKLVNAIGKLGD